MPLFGFGKKRKQTPQQPQIPLIQETTKNSEVEKIKAEFKKQTIKTTIAANKARKALEDGTGDATLYWYYATGDGRRK